MAEVILALRPLAGRGRTAGFSTQQPSFRRAIPQAQTRRCGCSRVPIAAERSPGTFSGEACPRAVISRVGTGSARRIRSIGDGWSEFQFDQNRIRLTRAAPGSAQPLPLMHRSAPPRRRLATAQSARPIRRRQASDTAQHALGHATRVSYVRAVGARTRNQA